MRAASACSLIGHLCKQVAQSVINVMPTKTNSNGALDTVMELSPLGVGIWQIISRIGDHVTQDEVFFSSSLDNYFHMKRKPHAPPTHVHKCRHTYAR